MFLQPAKEIVQVRQHGTHHTLLVVGRSPATQKITIALEDLAIDNREEAYRKLTEFLDISDAPQMRKFFEEELTPENATSGRWKDEISSPEFDAAYCALEQRLRSTLNS